MKIAIIVNPSISVPPLNYGGIERMVFMLIENLVKKGHSVTLYANKSSQVPCNLIGYSEDSKYKIFNLIKINFLTLEIYFKKFDLVHTFGRMSNIAFLMPLKIPKIVSYQLPPTLSQIQKALQLAAPNSLVFTGCSDYISNQIKDYCKVTTIYNGIQIEKFEHSHSFDIDDAPLVFLGRIQYEKGTKEAIEIAKSTGKKLIIAGNVPKEAIHEKYFKEHIEPQIDGNQITYIGPVNDIEKNKLLGKAAAFLMPVLWGEPFGIVMTEALACGTPVIGFRQGAIPEVIEDGFNGFVCDTLEQMIEAVKKIKMINRENCRLTSLNKFSDKVIFNQYESLYSSLIAKKK